MSKTVFVLGAGFNQFLEKRFQVSSSSDNSKLSLNVPSKEVWCSPPMSNNFFEHVLKIESSRFNLMYGIKEEVLNYIEGFFQYTKHDLMTKNFDLEHLFSLLDKQLNEAKEQDNKNLYIRLKKIQRHIVYAFGEVFFELEWQLPEKGREILKKFGEIIYKTNSDVITFNYDCLAERGIELASGEIGQKYKHGRPFYNWSRYANYRVPFTRLRLNGPNYWFGTNGRNEASSFYKNYCEQNYKSNFLKLHGSYNWFKYDEFLLTNPTDKGLIKGDILPVSDKIKSLPESLKNEILCFNADWQWGTNPVWSIHSDKHALEPLIIPPIYNKEKRIQKGIFSELWQIAKKILKNCEEVVFIGYSFPNTDSDAETLFKEALAINKNIKVTIVNPDDSIIENFCVRFNYKLPIQYYKYSGDYIESYEIPGAYDNQSQNILNFKEKTKI
jgi:hypothetical protein